MAGKRVTLKDVAQKVGVHASTVSRALNPDTRRLINPRVAQKILETIEELKYRPNVAAYSLRTNRSRLIGVIVPDIANPIFPPMMRGIESRLLERGNYALLGNTDSDRDRERELAEAFVSHGVDGLILASVNRADEQVVEALPEGFPLVTVNRRLDDERVSSVVHMEDEGVSRALTHLVSLGHRAIAVVAGPQAASTGLERYQAYLRHRGRLGLPAGDELVAFADAYTEEEGARCAEALLAARVPFTALMCANDRLAIGAIAALRRCGFDCPADISVTGYNDMPMVASIVPPLTTIRIQQYRMGAEAAAMVLRLVGGEAAPRHVVLPVELVVRGSTRAIAAG